jgi:hypothetical protein
MSSNNKNNTSSLSTSIEESNNDHSNSSSCGNNPKILRRPSSKSQHQQEPEQHDSLQSCSTHPNNSHPNNSRIWTRRFIMLMGLSLLIGGSIAIGAFFFISQSENTLAQAQFEAIAKNSLDTAFDITLRKRLGAKSLATIISYSFPNANMWPNISLAGFEDIANSIIVSNSISFAEMWNGEWLCSFLHFLAFFRSIYLLVPPFLL